MNTFPLVQPFVEHPAAGTNKRLSVERIYQRKTQLEHILLRPDTYVGSVEETTETMWVFDSEKEAIVKKQITFVPGLYKIFDEILGAVIILAFCADLSYIHVHVFNQLASGTYSIKLGILFLVGF